MLESLDQLLTRKLLLVTGKGGIGKTTVAALLALRASRLGKRVLLVEASAHDQLAPSFGLAPCGHVETPVEAGLSVINLNAKDNFREYIVKYLGLGMVFEKIFTNHMVTSFIETIPGIAELIMLGRLFYSAELREEDPFDLVVFDGPALGHFYSLMTTPQAVADAGIIGPVHHESERIREFLGRASDCLTVLVTTIDELSVTECSEFFPKLIKHSPAKVGAIFANRLLPPSEVASTAKLKAVSEDVFLFLNKRFQQQSRAISQLCNLAAPHIPLFGIQDLGALPNHLLQPWMHEAILKEPLCP